MLIATLILYTITERMRNKWIYLLLHSFLRLEEVACVRARTQTCTHPCARPFPQVGALFVTLRFLRKNKPKAVHAARPCALC